MDIEGAYLGQRVRSKYRGRHSRSTSQPPTDQGEPNHISTVHQSCPMCFSHNSPRQRRDHPHSENQDHGNIVSFGGSPLLGKTGNVLERQVQEALGMGEDILASVDEMRTGGHRARCWWGAADQTDLNAGED